MAAILLLGAATVGLGLAWKRIFGQYWMHRLEQGDPAAEAKLAELMPDVRHLLVRAIKERQPFLSSSDPTAVSAVPSSRGTRRPATFCGKRQDPAYVGAARVLATFGPEGEQALLDRLDQLTTSGRNVDHMLPALRLFKDRRAQQLCSRAWVEGRLDRYCGTELLGEGKLEAVLWYLACRQEKDGHWDASRWGARGATDQEVTALATLAFLGAGWIPGRGRYAKEVERALHWLARQQRGNGRVGSGPLKEHVRAGMAFSEVLAMTRNPAWKPFARAALDYTLKRRLPTGGWSEESSGKPDVALSALCIGQMKSAKLAVLNVPGKEFQSIVPIVDKELVRVSDGRNGKPASPAGLRAFAGAANACLQLGFRDRRLGAACDHLWKHRRTVMRSPELTMLARLLAFQLGGNRWRQWNRMTKDELVGKRADRADPRGPWPYHSREVRYLGDMGSAAFLAITMEIYYAYSPVFLRAEPAGTTGEQKPDPAAP